MTKPQNFPGRRLQRQMRAKGEIITAESGKHSTKKTPKETWSGARRERRGGKIGR